MGQNAEVMPRPLNLSIVIHSLEVRTIFSLFVLKKHMLGFAQIISVFRTGWRFARVGISNNGLLVRAITDILFYTDLIGTMIEIN